MARPKSPGRQPPQPRPPTSSPSAPENPCLWVGPVNCGQCVRVEAAGRWQPDYLLLTDADIVHGPENLRELVSRCETEGYDLVSLMVRLNCRSLWEKLLIPAFVFFFFKLYPPRWVADPTRRTSAAAGGCMLIRAATLDRVGGIDSIRRDHR
jgi:GT2 family glycosyltransferase